jgi:hypothetical protein
MIFQEETEPESLLQFSEKPATGTCPPYLISFVLLSYHPRLRLPSALHGFLGIAK